MSIKRPQNHDDSAPIRSHARTLATEYAELFGPFRNFEEWSAAADVIQDDIERAVAEEVDRA